MTQGYSADQIRAAERPLLDDGVPLMQRAAAGLAAEIERVLARRGPMLGRSRQVVLLVVGSGDNGGDALYAGAALAAAGHEVRILTTGTRVHEGGFQAALTSGATADGRDVEPGTAEFDAVLDGVDVVVDGILGIGTTTAPALRGRGREVARAIRPRTLVRATGAPLVVAVDVPSGIGVDDGSLPAGPDGEVVVLPALVTVTFGAVKAGLLQEPAASVAGDVRLIDIGLDLSGVRPVVSV
jgi:NAD(P)H-hydrate epimerase